MYVQSSAGVDVVVAVSAGDFVGTCATANEVITCTAVDVIIAYAAAQGVVAACAANLVVACGANNDIAEVGVCYPTSQAAVCGPAGGAPFVGVVQGVAGQDVGVDLDADQLGALVAVAGAGGGTGVCDVECEGVAVQGLATPVVGGHQFQGLVTGDGAVIHDGKGAFGLAFCQVDGDRGAEVQCFSTSDQFGFAGIAAFYSPGEGVAKQGWDVGKPFECCASQFANSLGSALCACAGGCIGRALVGGFEGVAAGSGECDAHVAFASGELGDIDVVDGDVVACAQQGAADDQALMCFIQGVDGLAAIDTPLALAANHHVVGCTCASQRDSCKLDGAQTIAVGDAVFAVA